MRRFEPVHLPESRGLNARASQTFLRHYNGCPRSGFLYQAHKDIDLKTIEMMRGTAIHEAIARCTLAAIDQGEPGIPPEIAKAITGEVLAELPVAVEEHDYIRESVYRWAAESAFDPGQVVAVETLFVMEIAGYQVRAKVDFAQLLDDGAAVLVDDYKSSRSAATWEEVARVRPDKSLAAKNFQLVLYAVLLAFGVPVRVEDCVVCDGHGTTFAAGDIKSFATATLQTHTEPCVACNGRGQVETPEPFSVASQAQRFDLAFVYPGIEDREGRMLRRGVSLTRLELVEYRASLEGLLTRVAASEASGDWPAVVSDAACSECPAAPLCPIPAELRDHRGTVNTPGEAAEALEVRHREQAEMRARGTELRLFVKQHGPVRFAERMVAEIGHTESVEIRDKDGMFAAQQRAIDYGEPFDRAEWTKVKQSFPLVVRELSDDELEEAHDGSSDNGADAPTADAAEAG